MVADPNEQGRLTLNPQFPIIKLSVIISTRNRAYALNDCLNSIQNAFKCAELTDAEIVVVDNGSSDNTSALISEWSSKNEVSVQLLSEPIAGLSRAQNRAIRSARGEIIVFTDDDCRMSEAYVTDLLKYNWDTSELVLRGGRIELGDSADLPLTINTSPTPMKWNRTINSARHESIAGQINGCNMAMRREVFERIGYFDERWGPGAAMPSGGDSDFLFRAYLAGISLEYVPDMMVSHFHGRKTQAEGFKLMKEYMIANGALCAKYFFIHYNLCRPFYWDVRNLIREVFAGKNTFFPEIGFSNKSKVFYLIQGVAEYALLGRGR